LRRLLNKAVIGCSDIMQAVDSTTSWLMKKMPIHCVAVVLIMAFLNRV
jgi:hypothetical protein